VLSSDLSVLRGIFVMKGGLRAGAGVCVGWTGPWPAPAFFFLIFYMHVFDIYN
jgi:hypothetical protein